jgi:hypothetical protein
MGRLIKAVLMLAIVGFGALVGYAYLTDMQPATEEVKLPVTLNAN